MSSGTEFQVLKNCGCWACREGRQESTMVMVVCDTCGNKRCPHATRHTLTCTGSNEPGQEGSAYEFGSGAASARRFNGGPLGEPERTRFEVRIGIDWRTKEFGDPEPEDLWLEARHLLNRALDHGFSPDDQPGIQGEVLRPHVSGGIDVEMMNAIVATLRSSADVEQHDIADAIQEALGQVLPPALPDEVLDPNVRPSRDGLEEHEVWVWLRGAKPAHWEIRGTGAVLDRPDEVRP